MKVNSLYIIALLILFVLCFSSNAGNGQVGLNPNLPDVACSQASASNTTAGLPTLDLQWVESRSKKAALKLEKLDSDLKNSKVTLFCYNYYYNIYFFIM